MQFIRPTTLARSFWTLGRPCLPSSLFLPYGNKYQVSFPKRNSSIFLTSTKVRYSRDLRNVIERKFSQEVRNKNVRKTLTKAEFRRLLSLAAPDIRKLTGAVCMLLISSAVTMIVPISLGKVIDIVYTSNPEKLTENLKNISLILVGVFLLGGLCNFGRIYLLSVVGQNITKRLRETVFASIIKQELAFFDRRKTGELVNRLSSDTNLVSQALTSNLSDGLRSGIMGIFGVSYMFYLSPALASVGLTILPVLAVTSIIYGRFIKKITKQVQDSLASATSVAEEKFSNIRTVKAFGNEKREVELYENKLYEVLKFQYKEALAKGIFFGWAGLSGNVVSLLVLCYGCVLVSSNAMTIGSLASFVLYSAYIVISMRGITTFYSELLKGLGASERLWEIIDRVPTIPITGGLYPEKPPRGCISFENVLFCYPERRDTPVLRNLNLEIDESIITAIVGSSGSGKSTVASLLLRLYDTHEGKILLDGVSIKELSPDWIKRYVGFVSQEPVLFNGTIRENILYGAPNPLAVTEEEIEQASREANCYDFITKTFPDKFETKVGEKGTLLSGGQKQRIALARALIKNPRLLILDEATSALDAESEHLVQEALERIMKGRTVLLIAHRLSSIKNSDQIVVLDKGNVVEQGTYQELLQIKEGVFKMFMKHQAFG